MFADYKILSLVFFCHPMPFLPPLPLFFHPLLLSLLDFIYAHAPVQLCDGFSTAMLNFTGQSILSALNVPSGMVQCAGDPCSPWSRFGTPGPCCLNKKHWGREAQGQGREKRNLGVPWKWTSQMLCYLIPCSIKRPVRSQGRWRRSGCRMMKVKK